MTAGERPEVAEQRARALGDSLGSDSGSVLRLSRGLLQAGISRISSTGPTRATSLTPQLRTRPVASAGAEMASGTWSTSSEPIPRFFSSAGGELCSRPGAVVATAGTGTDAGPRRPPIEHEDALSRLQYESEAARCSTTSVAGSISNASSAQVRPSGFATPRVPCSRPASTSGRGTPCDTTVPTSSLIVEAPAGPSPRPAATSTTSASSTQASAAPRSEAEALEGSPSHAREEASAGFTTAGGSASSSTGTARSRLRGRLGQDLAVKTKANDLGIKKALSMFRLLTGGQSITDYYDFGDQIFSSGCISKVLTARRKSDNAEVVLKMRPKGRDKVSERGWRQIMTQLSRVNGNHHVLDISEIIEDSTTYYIVMPKCDGGELFDLLATAEEIPEKECKRIIREILTAVGHLHKNDLIHRDIKPENILFDTKDPASPKTVKLIDFDTVAGWTPQSPKLKTFVGTPGYIAPEVLLGEASPQSDLWSVGVIFYILMTGDSPWTAIASLEDGTVGSPKAKLVYDQMKAEVLDWDGDPWPEFPLARDLCQKLMAFSTKARLVSVPEALAHPWLQES